MNSKLNTILKIISTVLITAVLLLAMLVVGVQVFGLKVYTVLSPSMEPDFPTGSLIYVKETDTSQLQINDVITFSISDTDTATHRIIELIPDDNDPTHIRFRTKGDANNLPDGSLVEPANVIGTPVFTIPRLGYLAWWIKTPPGLYVAIGTVIGIIIFEFIVDSITDKNKKAKKDSKEGDSAK